METEAQTDASKVKDLIDKMAVRLAILLEQFEDDTLWQERILRRFVFEVTSALYLDDPYDTVDEVRAQGELLDTVLRQIRSDLKKGDIEHAQLLIHYELGDY